MKLILHLVQSKSLGVQYFDHCFSFVHFKPKRCIQRLQDSVFKCLNISNGINYLNISSEMSHLNISLLCRVSHEYIPGRPHICSSASLSCKKNIYPRLSLSFTMKLENGLRAHLANRFLLNIDVAKIWLPPPLTVLVYLAMKNM